MPNDDAARSLARIGDLLAEDMAYPLDGTLLYAEIDTNFARPSIFKDLGDHILYRSPDLDLLGDALMEFAATQPAGRQWCEIEYVIRGDRFELTFTYPDQIDPEEAWGDRRDRIVRRHFGDKPIVYPQPEDDEDDGGQIFYV